MSEEVLSEIDGPALAAALESESPELGARAGLEQVGAGFYSFVFRTRSGWIVRVARTAAAATRHRRECVTLPLVAPHLSVAVPEPREVLPPRTEAPFGAVTYHELPGRLMTEADAHGPRSTRIAERLAGALADLHRIDPRSFPPGTLPEPDPGHHQRLWRTVAGPLEQRLPPEEWRQVRDWWLEFLDGLVPTFPREAPSHGDPWWENLTVDESGLRGILDWEYLSLSDPANDLGVTLEMGEPFFQTVLREYRKRTGVDDPTLELRSRQLGASRAFYGFEFAILRQDDGEWEDSMQSLRAGPILRS